VLQRIAVVVDPGLSSGQVAGAAATVTGGLRCCGFTEPIPDRSGTKHAAILWNLVVLSARSPLHLREVLLKAKASSVETVVFSFNGMQLSNSFSEYEDLVRRSISEDMKLAAIGIFGPDEIIRGLTKRCRLYG